MNIGLIVASLTPKGPVLVARDLANGLAERGHTVRVFFFSDADGVDFACPTEKISRDSLKRLAQCDVIHSHSLRPDLAAWALKNLWRVRARFVTTIHNYVERDLELEQGKWVSRFVAPAWRLCWRGLDAAVALTRDSQSYYRQTHPSIATSVIYNSRRLAASAPIDDSDRSALDGLKRSYQIIGANAAALKRKGLDQIIDALPGLPGHAFVLVGDGPELSSLMSRAAALGVSQRFLPLGFRKNATDYLPHYDIFAMPSLSEGMPLAMLEAVAAGVPVICSDIPVFREIFLPDEVGFFPLNDTAALIAQIDSLRSDLKSRTARARARVDAFYSPDAMLNAYLDLYAGLETQPQL